jgi:hypothetical protein
LTTPRLPSGEHNQEAKDEENCGEVPPAQAEAALLNGDGWDDVGHWRSVRWRGDAKKSGSFGDQQGARMLPRLA